MSQLSLLAFPPCADWVEELRDRGVVSFPILNDATRASLATEAKSYQYIDQPTLVGQYHVRQRFASCIEFSEDSQFPKLKLAFETAVINQFAELDESPISETLNFNEMVLQRYTPGRLGISPHRDQKRCRNLIAAFTLVGRAKFCVCDDRHGNNSREINSEPGSVIILRAGGFAGQDVRPFHFISDIREQRISFALRQFG